MLNVIELWKDIKGYEGWYQVSNLGNIKSLTRKVPYGASSSKTQAEKLLKHRASGKPVSGIKYLSVVLQKNKDKKQVKVHRLVAEAFCTKHPDCDVVNHIDNNPQNNQATNLEWTTVSGNNAHRHSQGRSNSAKGEEQGQAKFLNSQITSVKEMLDKGLSQESIAQHFGVNQTTISRIKLGKTYGSA